MLNIEKKQMKRLEKSKLSLTREDVDLLKKLLDTHLEGLHALIEKTDEDSESSKVLEAEINLATKLCLKFIIKEEYAKVGGKDGIC